MNNKILLSFLFVFEISKIFSQGYPWERPLKMAWSNNGVTFNTPAVFQDSSGVPSVIKWKGDTLICVFQWFRMPISSPTWDRVAVKFSYDNGLTWTQPLPIVINGLPANYQRPFDPTLIVFNNDSLRIYFSSSNGIPIMGLDSTVNTYSANSIDGVNYTFEPNARVDELYNRVIDPSVIFFNNAYHYISPIGSPQEGAYHYVSPDGLNFMGVPDIPSDNSHNWTGNYMINNTNDLRFYGGSPTVIWYNSTSNGGIWNGYVNTNIQGGDPSVLKVSNNNYLIIYVGNPYTSVVNNEITNESFVKLYPNPVLNNVYIKIDISFIGSTYNIEDQLGKTVMTGILNTENSILDLSKLSGGFYILSIGENTMLTFKVIKN